MSVELFKRTLKCVGNFSYLNLNHFLVCWRPSLGKLAAISNKLLSQINLCGTKLIIFLCYKGEVDTFIFVSYNYDIFYNSFRWKTFYKTFHIKFQPNNFSTHESLYYGDFYVIHRMGTLKAKLFSLQHTYLFCNVSKSLSSSSYIYSKIFRCIILMENYVYYAPKKRLRIISHVKKEQTIHLKNE